MKFNSLAAVALMFVLAFSSLAEAGRGRGCGGGGCGGCACSAGCYCPPPVVWYGPAVQAVPVYSPMPVGTVVQYQQPAYTPPAAPVFLGCFGGCCGAQCWR